MNDLISRAEAIELKPEFLNPNVNRETKEQTAIDRAYARGWNSCNTHWIKEIIEDLPSAQPERKKGKWIIKDNPGTGWYRVTCSECGEDVTSVIPMIGFFPNAKALWDFCPDCGADMRGESNE